MPKTLLVTRPLYDTGTYYLYHWSTRYINLAQIKGYKVLDLDKKRANRKELTSIIKKLKPHLVCFNGHGNYERILGEKGEVLVKINDNESLLVDTIVNILACGSGKLLGPACIKNNTLAFIAYQEEFVFYYNNQATSKPLNDNRAKLFLEPAMEIVNSLLKGHTVGAAYIKSQKMYLQNVLKILASNSSEAYLARYLLWDMRNQVCLGNKDTVL